MVKRNNPSAGGGKRATGSKKQRRGGRAGGNDDDMYQQPGKLMVNNPLIPPELDEDIDDDLAFNSDDERMYGHLFQSNQEAKSSKSKKDKSKPKKGRGRGDQDEDDDFFDDSLDAVGKAHGGGKSAKRSSSGAKDNDELYNYHEEGQTSDDDDDEYIDLSDMLDQSLAEEKKRKTTASKKKKATVEAEDGQQVTKKRRAAKLNDDDENLFGTAAVSDAQSTKSFGATLRTLVDSGDAQSAEELKARTRLQQAMNSKHNLLSTDMDDIAKSRLTRREVREVVKGDMKKYAPLLREMSLTKHMQFPMQVPDSNPTPSTIGGIAAASRKHFSATTPSDGTAPTTRGSANSLAGRMNALLATAGLARAGRDVPRTTSNGADGIGSFVRFDDDGKSYAPQDETEERPTSNYMAKLKAMLSYENGRRKRINRIKSKTYRRILRKEKDRDTERRQAAFELLHPELARQRLADRLAKARAEERVTQKHKNTSLWVKRAKRFANIDANAKDAVNEQLSIHQRLMAKMDQEAGDDMHERYDAEAEGTDSDEEERLVDELLNQMNREKEGGGHVNVEELTRKIWGLDAGDATGTDGGRRGPQTPTERARAELRAMKFMKAARERTEKGLQDRTEALLDSVRRARDGEHMSSGESDADGESIDADAHLEEANAALQSRKRFATKSANGAVERVNLKPRLGARVRDPLLPESDTVLSDADDGYGASGPSDDAQTGDRGLAQFAGDRTAHKTKAAKGTTSAVPLQSTKTTKSSRETVRYEGAKRARDAADSDALFGVQSSNSDQSDNEEPHLSDTFGDHGENETHDDAEESLRSQQQYLIARAFAQDDVDEDFLKEKEAQVEMIMKPEDKNQSLPGWGEWGGEDPALNRKHQEKLAHTAAQKRIERTFLVKSRADAALDHVIINHDGVELVPDRMTLHMVPRPFSNPTEFARSMRQPLGPEWSSALSFKERAQPRVEVRQGHSVVPLDLSLRKKTPKTKRRKTEKQK